MRRWALGAQAGAGRPGGRWAPRRALGVGRAGAGLAGAWGSWQAWRAAGGARGRGTRDSRRAGWLQAVHSACFRSGLTRYCS